MSEVLPGKLLLGGLAEMVSWWSAMSGSSVANSTEGDSNPTKHASARQLASICTCVTRLEWQMAQDRYPLLRLPPFHHDPASLAQPDFKPSATARWLHIDADDALDDEYEENGDAEDAGDREEGESAFPSPWTKSRGLTLTQLMNAAQWVHQELIRERVVFVHCQMGISRSPSIAAAAVALHSKIAVAEAFRRIKTARAIACPNPSFRRLLAQFQSQLTSTHGEPAGDKGVQSVVEQLTLLAEGSHRFEGVSSEGVEESVLWCPTVPTVSIEGYFELLPAMGRGNPEHFLAEYRAAVAEYEADREHRDAGVNREEDLQFGDNMTDEEWLASLA
jgi:hypothetical protein